MKEQLPIALKLAVEFHAGQFYGDSDKNYMYHLYMVDQLVIAAYVDKNQPHNEPYSKEPGDFIDRLRALAYLHDIIEDTDCTYEILRDRGICEELIVSTRAMSKVPGEDYLDYMRRVLGDDLASKCKMCDTATNLAHSILEQDERRVTKYTRQLSILKGWEII